METMAFVPVTVTIFPPAVPSRTAPCCGATSSIRAATSSGSSAPGGAAAAGPVERTATTATVAAAAIPVGALNTEHHSDLARAAPSGRGTSDMPPLHWRCPAHRA